MKLILIILILMLLFGGFKSVFNLVKGVMKFIWIAILIIILLILIGS